MKRMIMATAPTWILFAMVIAWSFVSPWYLVFLLPCTALAWLCVVTR